MIKNIIGYEGVYVIDSEAVNEKKIFSIRKNDYLKLQLHNGHLVAKLDGRTTYLHRLLAETFIPNPNGYDVVHHKDHNPLNNSLDNLEWMNISQHLILHRSKHNKKVYQYTFDGELFKIWDSVGECSRNGYNKGHVAACCRGEQKTHKGYMWSYVILNNLQ